MPGEQLSVPSRALISPRVSRILLPLVLAALMGILGVWSTAGGGYVAGTGDHFVLSPEGLSWVHPDAFKNDWFMQAAPQPHWFFDLITMMGESLGALSAVYALLWMAGLLAAGAATSLLAHRFVPGAPWAMGIAVTLVMAVMPWMMGGTGSPLIAMALPAVQSANLIYLVLAAMLCERRLIVIVVAPLIAILHVQQGSIVLVLLVAMLISTAIRERRLDRAMSVALVLTGAFVAFGLIIRPVASNLQDFVQICDKIIPYHCAAHLWTGKEIASSIGMIVLCALSVFLVPAAKRWLWLTTVGLALLGYSGGFLVDLLRIPLLGTLAQGVNVYRLAAVLLPFAIWGAFAPLLTRARGWRLLIIGGIWGVAWIAVLYTPYLPAPSRTRAILLGLALLVPFAWYLVARHRRQVDDADLRLVTISSGLLVVLLSAVNGGMVLRAPNFTFIGSTELQEWGKEVRDVVPSGDVIVASPRDEWVKLVTQRAVVVDCKDVPYGGAPWREWQKRIEDLGGFQQCVAPGPLLYNTLSADQLIGIADTYSSDFILVNPGVPHTMDDLEAKGWTHVVSPVGSTGADLMRRPR